MKRNTIIIIVIVLVILAVVIQLIPVPIRGHNPPVVQDVKWDTPQTAALARRACYDCHSNETVWPWYSYIAPVSWLISKDVTEGRAAFDLSDPSRIKRSAEEMVDEIDGGDMPPSTYLLMHPSAKLSEAEKQQLIQGIQNSIK